MKYIRTTVVEAVQWDGKNINDILELIPGAQPVHGKDGFLSVYSAEGAWEADLEKGHYLLKGDRDWYTTVHPEEFREQYKRVGGVVFPDDTDS